MKRCIKKLVISCLTLGFFMIPTCPSYAGSWKEDQNGWRYQKDDLTYQVGDWFQDNNGVWYHFDENGYMQTNWVQINGNWYYFTDTGAMLTDTTTPDGYQVDSTGAMVSKAGSNIEAGWRNDDKGWWYQLSNGDYVKNKWKTINGKKYYFDETGYMATGFNTIEGQDYYFDQSGALVKKNFVLDDTRYYVDESGVIYDIEEIEFGDSYWWGESTENESYSWYREEDEHNAGTQPDGHNESYALKVVEILNKERAKEGKSKLTINNNLMEAAGIRAEEIVEKMEHDRPDGSSWLTIYEELGVDYRSAGENIAGGQTSPDYVMNAWMNSAPHKKNILGNFSEVGVGCYQENGRFYWVQLFLKS